MDYLLKLLNDLKPEIIGLLGTIIGAVIGFIGALVGGRMAKKGALEATKQEHENAKILQDNIRKQTVNSILQAIYDEIHTLWERYMWGIGNELERLPEGELLGIFYPITQEYFTIYNSNALYIGSIDDHELRKAIVITYMKAKSLIDSYKMNNDYLQNYNNSFFLWQQTQGPAHQYNYQVIKQRMIEYVIRIKEIHYDLKNDVSVLLRMLREMLQIND